MLEKKRFIKIYLAAILVAQSIQVQIKIWVDWDVIFQDYGVFLGFRADPHTGPFFLTLMGDRHDFEEPNT